MSRPYPVGKKVAVIITMLLAVQKPSVLGSIGDNCQCMHAPFRMDCLRTHEEE